MQVGGHGRGDARPDFDASAVLYDLVSAGICQDGIDSTYRSIEHGDVVDKDILHNVYFVLVLAQGTDGNAVGTVAMKILHKNFRAVRFE